jgi:hypothetical protein
MPHQHPFRATPMAYNKKVALSTGSHISQQGILHEAVHTSQVLLHLTAGLLCVLPGDCICGILLDQLEDRN